MEEEEEEEEQEGRMELDGHAELKSRTGEMKWNRIENLENVF